MDNTYEKQVKDNYKRNEKFIREFNTWLEKSGVSSKTIGKHIGNVSFYLNDFMTYYEVKPMEEGIRELDEFFNDWFIRKCLFATKTSLKEYSASVKKFYKCMSEAGYISMDDYKEVNTTLKEHMDMYLDSLYDFDNGCFYDF